METSSEKSVLYVLDILKIDKIIMFALAIFAIVLFVRLLNHWSTYVQKKFSSKRLMILQVTTIISFIAYLFGSVGFFYIIFEPTKEIMVAVGGTAAVAFGFALKDLVGSVIAGFILLFDRPFQVGDRVEFDNYYGEIKSIGLRTVRLQTLDDNQITIPNLKFLSDCVSSGNTGALDMMIVSTFYVSIFEDLSKVKDILYEVVITSRFAYLEKNVSIAFEEIAISNTFAIKVGVKAYVLDVKYEKAFQSDVVSRGNLELNNHGIKRPILPQVQGESV